MSDCRIVRTIQALVWVIFLGVAALELTQPLLVAESVLVALLGHLLLGNTVKLIRVQEDYADHLLAIPLPGQPTPEKTLMAKVSD